MWPSAVIFDRSVKILQIGPTHMIAYKPAKIIFSLTQVLPIESKVSCLLNSLERIVATRKERNYECSFIPIGKEIEATVLIGDSKLSFVDETFSYLITLVDATAGKIDFKPKSMLQGTSLNLITLVGDAAINFFQKCMFNLRG